MRAYTITKTVHFRRGRRGHNRLIPGEAPKRPAGRIPRVSRLLALAINIDEMVRRGQVPDLATIARRGQVTRARVSQIVNMTLLAPDIQEDVLFLPKTAGGRDPVAPKVVEAISRVPDWERQRQVWRRIKAERLQPLADEEAVEG